MNNAIEVKLIYINHGVNLIWQAYNHYMSVIFNVHFPPPHYLTFALQVYRNKFAHCTPDDVLVQLSGKYPIC